jgi:membrane protein
VFRLLFRAARYNLIYGFFGSLIVVLVWVYFVFWIFYFGAQYASVADRVDVLVMQRLYKVSRQRGNLLERLLFRNPELLLSRYGRSYGDGEVIVQENSTGKQIYYVYLGKVRITREGNQQTLYTLDSGEFFGEMAYLLQEPRTAAATAQGETLLFEVPPRMFEELLRTSDRLARDVIRTLCNRLKRSADHLTL